MRDSRLPSYTKEQLEAMNIGKCIARVERLKVSISLTKKIHRCIVCGDLVPLGVHLVSKLGSSSARDIIHFECFNKYNLESTAKDYVRLPARIKSIKPNDLFNKLDFVLKELESLYKDVQWSVTKYDSTYKVSCSVGKSVCADYFALNWTGSVVKRRLSELLAYTLEQEEWRNARTI